MPEGPPVWICGDCHLGNLGPLADARGRVAVQIRDLDQTVIGNPAHDLVRLGLSLASAARGSDLPGVITALIVEELIAGYEAGLAERDENSIEESHQPRSIQALLKRSVRRRWRQLAEERLETVGPKVPLGRRFWPLAAEEIEALRELFATKEIAPLVSALKGGKVDDAGFENRGWMLECKKSNGSCPLSGGRRWESSQPPDDPGNEESLAEQPCGLSHLCA